ncbi:MAG TPA: sigma-70 family RNA polymerase sigma factor [Chryseolinea sp.]
MTEIEIIKGCLKQNASAQEKLYALYSRRMMAICIRYTKSRFEAEDIFHEAFVKVFKNIGSWQGGSFEGWMRRIFVNTAINHYHQNKKYFDHVDASYADYTPASNDNIISTLATQELLELVNQMPDGYKVIFNLHVVEGYSHPEIAELLNIAEGSSKSQLSKGKAYLKKLIENRLISAA